MKRYILLVAFFFFQLVGFAQITITKLKQIASLPLGRAEEQITLEGFRFSKKHSVNKADGTTTLYMFDNNSSKNILLAVVKPTRSNSVLTMTTTYSTNNYEEYQILRKYSINKNLKKVDENDIEIPMYIDGDFNIGYSVVEAEGETKYTTTLISAVNIELIKRLSKPRMKKR